MRRTFWVWPALIFVVLVIAAVLSMCRPPTPLPPDLTDPIVPTPTIVLPISSPATATVTAIVVPAFEAILTRAPTNTPRPATATVTPVPSETPTIERSPVMRG